MNCDEHTEGENEVNGGKYEVYERRFVVWSIISRFQNFSKTRTSDRKVTRSFVWDDSSSLSFFENIIFFYSNFLLSQNFILILILSPLICVEFVDNFISLQNHLSFSSFRRIESKRNKFFELISSISRRTFNNIQVEFWWDQDGMKNL